MYTIFNLNCWLLPEPFAVDNIVRLKKIIRLIQEYRPDYITLQEVWLQKYVTVLRTELPGYTFTASSGRFFNQSGLVTGILGANNYAERYTFNFTPAYSTVEKWGKKGCHTYTKDELTLMNTHLYSATNEIERNIPFLQFQCIEKNVGNTNAILCGDLNIEEREFISTNKLFTYNPVDCFTLLVYNPYANKRFNFTPYSKTIDYILPTKRSGLNISVQVIDEPVVSDHCALFAEVFT